MPAGENIKRGNNKEVETVKKVEGTRIRWNRE